MQHKDEGKCQRNCDFDFRRQDECQMGFGFHLGHSNLHLSLSSKRLHKGEGRRHYGKKIS